MCKSSPCENNLRIRLSLQFLLCVIAITGDLRFFTFILQKHFTRRSIWTISQQKSYLTKRKVQRKLCFYICKRVQGNYSKKHFMIAQRTKIRWESYWDNKNCRVQRHVSCYDPSKSCQGSRSCIAQND